MASPCRAASLALLVPDDLRKRSGAVFYSGRAAFAQPSPIYLIGYNPGGLPDTAPDRSVEANMERVLSVHPDRFSCYLHESWKDRPPGQETMQRRVVGLLHRLGCDPCLTPASNLFFVRSREAADMAQESESLAAQCWPFHKAVIERLGVSAVICFGHQTGRTVADRLNATQLVDTFEEDNGRRWRNYAHAASNGSIVFSLTHPSRANWSNPTCDPVPMIQRVMRNTTS